MLTIIASTNRRAVRLLLSPQRIADPSVNRRVARIVADVRRDGDPALLRYARTLDRLDGPLEVTRAEIEAAAAQVPASIRAAIRTAARNIRAIARRQVPRAWRARVAPGVAVEGRVVPLDRVGCYVPGGRYPLPSSLLMTAIPAAVAGVTEIVAVCPRPEPVVLAAAAEAGVSRLFRIGGAHAVAALAYGTRTVPRVDKIVGPGNRWVSAAKALVAADCGIDFYAGPTEIVIVSARGPAEWIAADLIAQAEHDPDARAVLITPDEALAKEVAVHVAQQAPHDGPARAALRAHGGIIVTPSMDEALALANDVAAEHLVVDDDASAEQVRCAGSLFVGRWSAQVAGDYAIGSNHVLPTAGAARVRGGLSAADFVRQITVQRLTQEGLARIGPSVMALAQAEGLISHAESIAVRLRRDLRGGAIRARAAVRQRQDGKRAATAGARATTDAGRSGGPVKARGGRR
jgi:histidinol dehydrogenase